MAKKIIILTLISAFIIGGIIFFKFFNLAKEKEEENRKLIETNFVQLELENYPLFDKPFFITYDQENSNIYAVNRNENSIYQISFDANYKNPLAEKFITIPKNDSIEEIFVLDISYDGQKIYVSAINEKLKNDDCYYLILYAYDLKTKKWQDIFKSNPCIAKGPFTIIGGRITHNEENIYLSGGNFFSLEWYPYKFDGFPHNNKKVNTYSTYSKLISSTNIFGSIVQINKKTNISKKISFGHRNPGGLFYDKYRNILWETEHGPRGGDELNIIKKDKQYGWPDVSYGTSYRKKLKVDFKTQYNSHLDFEVPVFSWVPSIGISQIGVVSSNGKFSYFWNKNDLIISSLKDKSIYRNRFEEGRVIYSERIYIGERLRSLVVSENIIFTSTDNGSLITIRPSEDSLTEGAFP